MGSRVLRTKPFQKPAPPSEGPFQSRGKSGVSGVLLVMTKGTALINETQKEARATPPPTVWNLPPGTSGLAQNTTHHLESLLLSLPWPARGGREAQQPYEITASYRPGGQEARTIPLHQGPCPSLPSASSGKPGLHSRQERACHVSFQGLNKFWGFNNHLHPSPPRGGYVCLLRWADGQVVGRGLKGIRSRQGACCSGSPRPCSGPPPCVFRLRVCGTTSP